MDLIEYRVCWRPLSINLNASDIQTIESFVIKTLGSNSN